MPATPRDASFWEPADLGRELRRVFEICHGCRRCFNVCPSFGTLFQRIDAIDERQSEAAGLARPAASGAPLKAEGEHAAAPEAALARLPDPVDGLGEQDRRRVVDECYGCRLCFNLCPYHPPHRFDLDFPRLMLRAKAVRVQAEGVRLLDRLLSRVDVLGSLASLAAPLVNALHRWPAWRVLLEKVLGIHRGRNLPRFAPRTFRAWWDWRGPRVWAQAQRQVALFYTCSVNYNEPQTGQDAVLVLERQGLEVQAPRQRCCGMPRLDCGDIAGARAAARANVRALYPLARRGLPILVLGPTCSYMLREEYPWLMGGEQSRVVARQTRDVMEYLAELQAAGRLAGGLEGGLGRVAYHLPCHWKAQNRGVKAKRVLEAIGGTSVAVVDRCSAHDGTWSMKREYYELSLKYGAKLFDAIREADAQAVATDCPLAALQIEKGTGRAALHPIRYLARAYGIDPDPA